jgi:hypothetical protein
MPCHSLRHTFGQVTLTSGQLDAAIHPCLGNPTGSQVRDLSSSLDNSVVSITEGVSREPAGYGSVHC